MTREIAHQQMLDKAPYAIQSAFPPGKLAGMPEFTQVCINMSPSEQGASAEAGRWNHPCTFEIQQAKRAADGRDGLGSVGSNEVESQSVQVMAARTASKRDVNPATGAMLGRNAATTVGAELTELTEQRETVS